MKIAEIIAALEDFAPRSLQENYDNSGLICGDANVEVTNALLCLDCVEEVVQEAINNQCNLIIAHHPIIFSGLKTITGKNYVERTIIKAIKNDIAIFAVHTNLDNVLQGVNAKIAQKLGINTIQILQPKTDLLCKVVVFVPNNYVAIVRNAMANVGAGLIGNYDFCSFNVNGTGTFRALENAKPFVGEIGHIHTESEIRLEMIAPKYAVGSIIKAMIEVHPYEEVAYDVYPLQNGHPQIGSGILGELEEALMVSEFLTSVKAKMQLKMLRYTSFNKEKVKRVAICGGSGAFLIKSALNAGADAYITADIKYHEFFDAENSMMICDIGHYESEQFTTEIFYEVLSKKFTNFAPIFSKIITNPIKYF